MIDAWRKQNFGKRKKPKFMKRMAEWDIDNRSTLSSAKFKETIHALVLPDNCSEDNLMLPDIFDKLKSSNPHLVMTQFDKKIVYALAVEAQASTGTAKVICGKTVKADVELRIRHGASLLLRNVEWAVSDQQAEHVLIGRPVLEGLGLDTKKNLEAASDKHNGIVNVPEILPKGKDLKGGTLAKITRDDGIFHGRNGDDGFADDDDIYIDLGEDSNEKLHNTLAARIKKTKENGLSEKGAKQLRHMVFEFQDISGSFGKVAASKS